jgi:arginine exporter protein ArgO
MKRKTLIGVIVVIGIAAAITMMPLTTGALIVVWIYLAWMVWKRKTQIFHNQMEPKSAERRLKWLKVSLLVAAISFVVFLASTVLLRALHALFEGKEELFFFITIFSLTILALGTICGLVIFLNGRRKQSKEIPK